MTYSYSQTQFHSDPFQKLSFVGTRITSETAHVITVGAFDSASDGQLEEDSKRKRRRGEDNDVKLTCSWRGPVDRVAGYSTYELRIPWSWHGGKVRYRF